MDVVSRQRSRQRFTRTKTCSDLYSFPEPNGLLSMSQDYSLSQGYSTGTTTEVAWASTQQSWQKNMAEELKAASRPGMPFFHSSRGITHLPEAPVQNDQDRVWLGTQIPVAGPSTAVTAPRTFTRRPSRRSVPDTSSLLYDPERLLQTMKLVSKQVDEKTYAHHEEFANRDKRATLNRLDNFPAIQRKRPDPPSPQPRLSKKIRNCEREVEVVCIPELASAVDAVTMPLTPTSPLPEPPALQQAHSMGPPPRPTTSSAQRPIVLHPLLAEIAQKKAQNVAPTPSLVPQTQSATSAKPVIPPEPVPKEPRGGTAQGHALPSPSSTASPSPRVRPVQMGMRPAGTIYSRTDFQVVKKMAPHTIQKPFKTPLRSKSVTNIVQPNGNALTKDTASQPSGRKHQHQQPQKTLGGRNGPSFRTTHSK